MSPQNRLLSLLLGAGVMLTYIDRLNIAYVMPNIAHEYTLSNSAQGLVLSLFSWGYVIYMLPGGIAITRYGSYRALKMSSVCWSGSTLLAAVSPGPFIFGLARLGTGTAEAPVFPANALLVAQNFRQSQRGQATALFEGASYVGAAICAPLSLWLLFVGGWRATFFGCGIVSICWLLLWTTLGRRFEAEQRPRIKHGFREFGVVARSLKLNVLAVVFFCYNFNKSFYLTWLPTFLVQNKGFNSRQLSWASIIPFLIAALASYTGGVCSDRLCRTEKRMALDSRIIPIFVGLILASTSGLVVLHLNYIATVIILTIAFGALISVSAPLWTLPAELFSSDDYIALAGSYMNTISNVGGIVAPILFGVLLDATHAFTAGVLITSGIAVAGAVLAILTRLLPIREVGLVGT